MKEFEIYHNLKSFDFIFLTSKGKSKQEQIKTKKHNITKEYKTKTKKILWATIFKILEHLSFMIIFGKIYVKKSIWDTFVSRFYVEFLDPEEVLKQLSFE